MSESKILTKHRVITKGGGTNRVVLDPDAGIIYAYQNPDKVIGVFEKAKGWVLIKQPHYRQGSWGRPSSGDYEGNKRVENARNILQALKASYYELNLEKFFTVEEAEKFNAAAAEHNKLIARLRELNKDNPDYEGESDRPMLDYRCRQLSGYATQTPKGEDVLSIAERMESALEVFITGKGKAVKLGNYSISKNKVNLDQTVIAFRDAAGSVFLNSMKLPTSHFEQTFMGGQSMIQSEIRKIAKYSIPFNVLAAAELELSETTILDQGPEEDFTIKATNRHGQAAGTEERHFTGALLLENSGRKFLMDVDRVEIKHSIFNAFFVEVDKKVKTIAEAYEAMKPKEVRDAEKAKLEVKRQGEWFFIKTDKTLTVDKESIARWMPQGDEAKTFKGVVQKAVAHGKGRPNNLYVPMGFGELDQYVCGTVTHQGREHRPLNLGARIGEKGFDTEQNRYRTYTDAKEVTFDLWKLVPNATIGNFTITGDVD